MEWKAILTEMTKLPNRGLKYCNPRVGACVTSRPRKNIGSTNQLSNMSKLLLVQCINWHHAFGNVQPDWLPSSRLLSCQTQNYHKDWRCCGNFLEWFQCINDSHELPRWKKNQEHHFHFHVTKYSHLTLFFPDKWHFHHPLTRVWRKISQHMCSSQTVLPANTTHLTLYSNTFFRLSDIPYFPH